METRGFARVAADGFRPLLARALPQHTGAREPAWAHGKPSQSQHEANDHQYPRRGKRRWHHWNRRRCARGRAGPRGCGGVSQSRCRRHRVCRCERGCGSGRICRGGCWSPCRGVGGRVRGSWCRGVRRSVRRRVRRRMSRRMSGGVGGGVRRRLRGRMSWRIRRGVRGCLSRCVRRSIRRCLRGGVRRGPGRSRSWRLRWCGRRSRCGRFRWSFRGGARWRRRLGGCIRGGERRRWGRRSTLALAVRTHDRSGTALGIVRAVGVDTKAGCTDRETCVQQPAIVNEDDGPPSRQAKAVCRRRRTNVCIGGGGSVTSPVVVLVQPESIRGHRSARTSRSDVGAHACFRHATISCGNWHQRHHVFGTGTVRRIAAYLKPSGAGAKSQPPGSSGRERDR